MLSNSKKTIAELEEELIILKTMETENFPIHDKQLTEIREKAKKFHKNIKYLEEFSYWLVMRGINLRLCSIWEKSTMFKVFAKTSSGIKRTQTERNCIKEVIERCCFE